MTRAWVKQASSAYILSIVPLHTEQIRRPSRHRLAYWGLVVGSMLINTGIRELAPCIVSFTHPHILGMVLSRSIGSMSASNSVREQIK